MAEKGNAYDQLFILTIILYHNNSDGIKWWSSKATLWIDVDYEADDENDNDDYDHGWSHLAESATSK